MAGKTRPIKVPVSSARAKRARKSERPIVRHRPDAELDFTDVPALTDAQLKRARRVGRPPEGTVAKQLIALRIDTAVLTALRQLAEQQQIGYQTLIQCVLAKAVR